MTKTWCEDITWYISEEKIKGWRLLYKNQNPSLNLYGEYVPYQSMFCPICGTPRPSEDDELVEEVKKVLMANFPYGHPNMSELNWESTAKAAISFLKEKWHIPTNPVETGSKSVGTKSLRTELADKFNQRGYGYSSEMLSDLAADFFLEHAKYSDCHPEHCHCIDQIRKDWSRK